MREQGGILTRLEACVSTGRQFQPKCDRRCPLQTARSILYMLFVVAPIVALEPGYLIPLCVGVIANLGLMVIAAAAIGSPMIGAYFILTVVRRLNHRDDPRHVHQPPDHPRVAPVPPCPVEVAIVSQDVSPLL